MKTIVLTLVLIISLWPAVLYAIPEGPITVQYWAPQKVKVAPFGSAWLEISAFDGDYSSLLGLTLYEDWDNLEFSWNITKGDGKLQNQTNWFQGPNLYKSKIEWVDLTGKPCTWSDILVTVDDIGSSLDISGLTWTNDSPTSRTFETHVVPAPSALVLLGCGLAGLVGLRRKRLLK